MKPFTDHLGCFGLDPPLHLEFLQKHQSLPGLCLHFVIHGLQMKQREIVGGVGALGGVGVPVLITLHLMEIM